ENWFFSECGTGEVPVIVILTKFDALDTKAFITLRKEGKSRIEARELASQRAVSSFEEVHLETLAAFPYSPKGHVYLRNMNKEGHDCGDLVERTAAALDDETLRQLFVSTQRNKLKICIRYGLERVFSPYEPPSRSLLPIYSERDSKEMIFNILRWFPQYSYHSSFTACSCVYVDNHIASRSFLLTLESSFTACSPMYVACGRKFCLPNLTLPLLSRSSYVYCTRQPCSHFLLYTTCYLLQETAANTLYLKLCSEPLKVYSLQGRMEFAITIVILADFGFLLWDNYIDPLKAIDVYEQCVSIQAAIAEATNQAVQIFISHGKRDKGKEQLKKQMVQIALDNRLPSELLTNPIVTGKQQE
ncbi:hypothetical protein FRC16_003146, partial [Serendipita sp. 398]